MAALEVESPRGAEAQHEKRDALAGDVVLDPEERERREVLGKARLGNAIRAVIEGRPLSGSRERR